MRVDSGRGAAAIASHAGSGAAAAAASDLLDLSETDSPRQYDHCERQAEEEEAELQIASWRQ